MDAVSQKPYYYNSQTGESTWTRPSPPASWRRQARHASLAAESGASVAIACAAPHGLSGLPDTKAGHSRQLVAPRRAEQ